MMLADLATGKSSGAEVCFLIACILFVIYAVLALLAQPWPGRIMPVLLGVGLALVSFGWLLL